MKGLYEIWCETGAYSDMEKWNYFVLATDKVDAWNQFKANFHKITLDFNKDYIRTYQICYKWGDTGAVFVGTYDYFDYEEFKKEDALKSWYEHTEVTIKKVETLN